MVDSPVHMRQVSLAAGKASSANSDLWSPSAKLQSATASCLIRLASFKRATCRIKYVSHTGNVQCGYVIQSNKRRLICVAHAIGTSSALPAPCIRHLSAAGLETLHHQPPNPSEMGPSMLSAIKLGCSSQSAPAWPKPQLVSP